MKYCRSCRHLTAGRPMFCPSCGRSYDTRVCPKGHANNRAARACGACGARDLSQPHPGRALVWARARIPMGIALWLLTVVYAEGFAARLLSGGAELLPAMLPGVALGLLWTGFVGLGAKSAGNYSRR